MIVVKTVIKFIRQTSKVRLSERPLNMDKLTPFIPR